MFEVIIERAKKAIEYEFNQSKYVTNIFNKKFNEEIAHYYIDFIHYIEEDTSDVFYIETIEEETKQKLKTKDQIPFLNEDEKNLLVHLVTLHVARRLNSLSALQAGQEITYSELTKLDKNHPLFGLEDKAIIPIVWLLVFIVEKTIMEPLTWPNLKVTIIAKASYQN